MKQYLVLEGSEEIDGLNISTKIIDGFSLGIQDGLRDGTLDSTLDGLFDSTLEGFVDSLFVGTPVIDYGFLLGI